MSNLRIAFEFDVDCRLHEVDIEDALARWSGGAGPFLLYLEPASRNETQEFLGRIGLDDDATEEITESGHAPRVREFGPALLFEHPARIDRQLGHLATMTIICLDRLVVIVRAVGSEATGRDPGQVDFRCRPVRPTAMGILAAIVRECSLDLRRDSLDVRHRTVALGRRMDADPESVEAVDIVKLKDEIIDVDAVVEERIPALESLLAGRVDEAAIRDEVRVALANTRATDRRLDRLDRRVADLQVRFDAHLQEKTNLRLSRLTIISAIFLPLTLIAGIYGMNFERMPELHYRYAYPIAMTGMAALAVGLLVWFKRRGWME
jgi:magnesium transporter